MGGRRWSVSSDQELQEQRIAALEREIAELRRRTGVVDPRDQPRPPQGPTRRPVGVMLLVAGVVVALLGVFAAFIYAEAWSKADGTLSSSGPPLGRFDAHIVGCRSGAAFMPQFLGADLDATGEARVRVVGKGSSDATVLVWAPNAETPLPLRAADCSTFDVGVEMTGSEVNDVRAVDGHARLECALPAGGRVTADIVFDACH